jgi:NADPH:quinone reductase-like Zn-dependent oxidoreductase
MKAALIRKQGGPEVLEYDEMPDPIATVDEIVVDIHAASVNGADWKVRAGSYGSLSEFPYILGRDFSGVISVVGAEVKDLRVGDAVFAVCDGGQEGAYAEKISIKAAIVAKKPKAISHTDMASLSLAGLTALVAVEDTLKLKPSETILIQGGAGGVASFAIQVAKALGAYVITTASTANHDFLNDLGADKIIDYHTQDFTELVSNCDAVFDTVGGDVAKNSFAVLKSGGRAAFIASGGTAPEPPRDDVASLRPNVERDRAHLERIVELVESGAVRAPEIKLFPLSEAAAAHAISESRHLRGKLVFTVR